MNIREVIEKLQEIAEDLPDGLDSEVEIHIWNGHSGPGLRTTSVEVDAVWIVDDKMRFRKQALASIQGQLHRDLPADLQILTGSEPVYKRFKGWSTSTSAVTAYKSLPVEAKRYLQYMEDTTECPIDIISTGSKRDATIMLKNPLKTRSRARSPRSH